MWWIEQAGQLGASWLRGAPGAQGRGRRFGAQSTVEYALVGALVVIAAATALTVLGGELNTVFSNISSTLKTAAVGH